LISIPYLCPSFLKRSLVMKILEEFSIPIGGLLNGEHKYKFRLNNSFFEAFESKEIKDGKFEVEVTLNKFSTRTDFNFKIVGSFASICDRCLEEIRIDIESEYDLIGRYGIGEEEAEFFYIEDQNKPVNIAKFIFEFVNYSIPLMKVCKEKENPACYELLDKINPNLEDEKNPMWEDLNKINFN